MSEIISHRESLLESCKTLKLNGVRSSIEKIVTLATQEKWSYDQIISTLLNEEISHRKEVRKRSLIRKASLPSLKYLEDLRREDLPKDMAIALPELETLDFIKNHNNIIMYGNPGTGKTHCAIGLGIRACQAGYNVLYTSIPHLLVEINEYESQRRLRILQKRFEKADLVICDEFGYKSFDKKAAEDLFNIISLRAGRKSTILTTNLGFDKWDQIFTDKIIANAMVDRLTEKSFLIDMTGVSYRLKSTQEWLKERKKKNKN